MSFCGGYSATACRDPRGALASMKMRVHGDVRFRYSLGVTSVASLPPTIRRTDPPPQGGLHNEGYGVCSPNIETARLAYGSQVTIQYCNSIVEHSYSYSRRI